MGNVCSGKKKIKSHKNKTEDIFDHYKISGVLGFGAFGVVRKGHSIKPPSETVAIKTIEKARLDPVSGIEDFKSELAALKRVDHPNIIKLYGHYENEKYFYIVTECCSGGELFERIVKLGQYSESDASDIFVRILRAIQSLHSNGICHRDIKPENFLFMSEDPAAEIKLIDFGFAKLLSNSVEEMKTFAGTPHYIPPEMIAGNRYTLKCDVWSAGIVLYMLLSGEFPFNGEARNLLFQSITREEVRFEGPKWSNTSEEAKNLISKMLAKNPEERITTDEALSHPWFVKGSRNLRVSSEAVESISLIKSNSGKVVMNLVYQYVNDVNIHELREIFEKLDQDKNGYLTWEEVCKAINEGKIQQEDISRVLGQIQKSPDGRINYSEFLDATLKYKMKLNEDIIWSAFKHFDVDESGYITQNDAIRALSYTGHAKLEQIDQFEGGKISYEAFRNVLLGNI